MFHAKHITACADDDTGSDWADRCDHWLEATKVTRPKRRKRERNSTPLILCGHGVSLRVEQGTLVIRDGFTHYPQKQETHRFFPGSRDIPTRILLLDGSGTLSFDVLSWLGEQGVALARVKWTGEVAAIASGTGFASDREKVQWQHETRGDETKRIAFAADLIGHKLASAADTLTQHFEYSPAREAALLKFGEIRKRLSSETFVDVNDIRALEGRCAALYFEVWYSLEMKWIGTGRKPIPDDWRHFTSRSTVANVMTAQNKSASHPVNAMLNYGYAVRLAKVQLQAITDGYDPTIGILHHARPGKPAFALDLIEPERPRVDAAILALIQSRAFSGADFILRPDGVCRLSPQLARVVAQLALNAIGDR